MKSTSIALFLTLLSPAWGGASLASWPIAPAAQGEVRLGGKGSDSPAAGASVRRQVAAMGTLLAVELHGPDRRQALLASEQVLLAVERTEARLSTWRADSELSAAQAHPSEGTAAGAQRRGAGCELSAELHAELAEALLWSDATGGAFDPRIAALVRAFDLRGPGRVPTTQEVEAALWASGPDALELRAGALWVHRPGAGIDEGGFGKGAGLDRAVEALDGWARTLPSGAGAPTSARLDLGGQVAFWGEGARELLLAHPRDRARAVLRVQLPEGARSAATSANGVANGAANGAANGVAGAASAPVHLLDPRTGQPAPDLGSVTALAPTALGADALSTGFFVLGPEASFRAIAELAPAHAPAHALWLLDVPEGLEVLASEGLAPLLEPALGFELIPRPDAEAAPKGARRWLLRAHPIPPAEPDHGAPQHVPPTPLHAPHFP